MTNKESFLKRDLPLRAKLNCFRHRFVVCIGVAVLLSIISVYLNAQGSARRSLIIASCDSTEPCQETLRQFVFDDGVLVSQEVLSTLPRGRSHFSNGISNIIDGTYVVSPYGEVFDVATKQYYAERVGEFVAYEDGLIYFDEFDSKTSHRGRTPIMPTWVPVGRGLGHTYQFDLAKKKYDAYDRPNFFSVNHGPRSPNGNRSLAFDRCLDKSRILLVKRDGKYPTPYQVDTIGKPFGKPCKKDCTTDLPAIWIDNEHFIVARDIGQLTVVDIRTKKWDDISQIATTEKDVNSTFLLRDDSGSIIYWTGKAYRINISALSFDEVEGFGLGNDFRSIGFGDLKTFAYGEQKLGSFNSRFSKTVDGYLAAEIQEKPLLAGSSEGVQVWSSKTAKWIRINIPFSPHILGWIQN
jgi:hypothetical protein